MAFVAALGALAPRDARAEVPLELTWVAPAGCPRAGAVRERIRALAGEALRDMHQLRAEGRVTREGSGYRLTLKVYEDGAAFDRTIESASCADLAGAAAVTLGLLLRRGASAETPEGGEPASRSGAGSANAPTAAGASSPAASAPNDANRPSRAETEATSDERTDESSSESGSARGFQLFLRAPVLGTELLRLSPPAFGGGAAVGVRHQGWRVAVDARTFLERSLWSSEFPDVGVTVTPATLSLSGCRGFRRLPFELGPCLLLGVERLRFRGTGPNVATRDETLTSFVLGAGGAAHLYLSEWFALTLGAGLAVPSQRPRISLGGLGELRTLGAVKVDVSLGSEWIF